MPSKNEQTDINRLCAKCLRHCHQPGNVLLLECPRFLKRPFKISQPKFEQMDLFPPSE